ncbi:MAG: hypothetical protein KF864_05785 [Phycisphaeraceae bacterium]|nr:hypothetical protein [Phycisphaeraceae bacterium]
MRTVTQRASEWWSHVRWDLAWRMRCARYTLADRFDSIQRWLCELRLPRARSRRADASALSVPMAITAGVVLFFSGLLVGRAIYTGPDTGPPRARHPAHSGALGPGGPGVPAPKMYDISTIGNPLQAPTVIRGRTSDAPR